MKRVLVVAGALLLSVGAVIAQQDVVKKDQDAMKANGRALGGVLAPMFKGEKPYDQAAVDAALKTLEDTAKKLPTMFPGEHQGPEGRRRLQRLAQDLGRQGRLRCQDRDFAKAVTEAKAKIKDADTLKANFPGDRQGMRRLPRDLPRQEQLDFRLAQTGRGRTRDASGLFLIRGREGFLRLCEVASLNVLFRSRR